MGGEVTFGEVLVLVGKWGQVREGSPEARRKGARMGVGVRVSAFLSPGPPSVLLSSLLRTLGLVPSPAQVPALTLRGSFPGEPCPRWLIQVQVRGGGLSCVRAAQGWGSECLCPKFMSVVGSTPG